MTMPNAPKTPTRTIRIADDLWFKIQAKAAEDGVTVTSLVILALYNFLADTPAEIDEPEWDMYS